MNEPDVLGYRGSTVVVTGCASGMGEATARVLGELGARVHAVDIRPPSVPHETYHETDLADPAQIDRTAAALRDVGPIHHLFNCAGIPHTFGPLACVAVNYIGTRYLTEQLLPALADGAGIASIASDAGMGWQANLPTLGELVAIADPDAARRWCEEHPEAVRDGYSFSKELVIMWTFASAVPLARERRIRTNCIGPCPTNTAFMVPTVAELGQDYFDRFPYPLLDRMATAEEQAWPLVLLNSARNAVVTGTVLYTDQGFAAGLYTGQIDPAVLTPG
jgi:NAD(P)-dependent dehydrogenase (short-subunit alcohol dehydrogenase family)